MLFLYKPDFQFQKAKVEKKVCLPAGEFEEFLRNPLENLPCIQDHVELMKADPDGLYHCLLVTGEGRHDGVLVESEGYGYARYASYVPDAAALEYDSLSEFGAGMSRLADRMILEGTSDTGDGNWVFYLDQIQKECDFSFSENLIIAPNRPIFREACFAKMVYRQYMQETGGIIQENLVKTIGNIKIII